MADPYPIIILPSTARDRSEPMGTKEKFWFDHTDGHPWLFKFNRPNHGDDWSEKIASGVAALLGLPHATVEMARFEERPGVISRDFTNRGRLVLVHGNELMVMAINPRYPKDQNYGVTEHTVANVRSILDGALIRVPPGISPDEGFETASDVFAGYLMLDALVGNTDRHHENWAVVAVVHHADTPEWRFEVQLAPTFDHASCLGFNLSDEERRDRMMPNHNRSVETFADRAKSKLYLDPQSRKPLGTIAAFVEWTRDLPHVRRIWIDRLASVTDENVWEMIERVPEARMSPAARDFAYALIRLNRARIMQVQ